MPCLIHNSVNMCFSFVAVDLQDNRKKFSIQKCLILQLSLHVCVDFLHKRLCLYKYFRSYLSQFLHNYL